MCEIHCAYLIVIIGIVAGLCPVCRSMAINSTSLNSAINIESYSPDGGKTMHTFNNIGDKTDFILDCQACTTGPLVNFSQMGTRIICAKEQAQVSSAPGQ